MVKHDQSHAAGAANAVGDAVSGAANAVGNAVGGAVQSSAIDLVACQQRGIVVSNVRNYAKHTVPEHTFALIFALRRSICAYRDAVKAGRWQEAEIQSLHRVQAADMCRYYRDKIMMQMLGSRPLSEFKRDLYHVLTGGQLLHRHRGMIWKLPYFYAEDQAKSQLTQMFRDHEVPWNFYADLPTLDLTPVVMIMVSRRTNENQEFWFRDQQGSPVLWRVDVRNPLISLVRGLWQRPGALRLHGAWRLSSVRSGCRHVIVHMPELVHD